MIIIITITIIIISNFSLLNCSWEIFTYPGMW